MTENMVLVNTGLLIIRLVIGLTFFGHGAQKLFGWFGGTGIEGMGNWLKTLGLEQGAKVWAILAGLFELIGGLLFAAGVLTWLGAIMIVIVMIDAIYAVHGKNGYWLTNGGFEYNLVLIAVCIGTALIGPGDYVLLYKP
ncbi:DoxX family protein [Bacillus xiapuensis]|uniref:DoxX family protein n=1 Tax=Bacillus xiapuensis TaxID=2014075 RepID=A0ABU6N4K7_9BACI|nr:DoxX family protein [Bacillus xiapuensis]